jgi:hypothetical protein
MWRSDPASSPKRRETGSERRTPVRGLSRRAALAGTSLAASACATPKRIDAVPTALTARAEPLLPHIRYFPDRDPEPFARLGHQALDRERAWLARSGHTGPLPPADILAVSGGGGDGAFGAGLLVGWSEHGDRPAFKLVTGISTGALIAPFAFAGPKYDAALRDAYTNIQDADIFEKRSFLAAIFDDALADTRPMVRLAQRYYTRELLDDIAAESAKGRVLLVGTTNLDAREPVYWDMGAIAADRSPEAMKLFHRITMASAAMPGAFPPVMIDVTVDGKKYQEMHVDGGATRQAFIYPQTLHLAEDARKGGFERKRAVYIIRNSRLDPDWASVDRRTLSIASRAVTSLIHTQGVGDLIRMYLTAMRDGLDYNLAYIPSTFTTPRKSEFDLVYMRALYDTGYAMAREGYRWSKHAPGYGPAEGAAP